jgi:hypothetical protein
MADADIKTQTATLVCENMLSSPLSVLTSLRVMLLLRIVVGFKLSLLMAGGSAQARRVVQRHSVMFVIRAASTCCSACWKNNVRLRHSLLLRSLVVSWKNSRLEWSQPNPSTSMVKYRVKPWSRERKASGNDEVVMEVGWDDGEGINKNRIYLGM